MSKVEFEVKGLSELAAKLGEVEPKLAKRIEQRALRTAAYVIANEVHDRAPEKTGELKKKVIVKLQKLTAMIGIRYEGIRAKTSRKGGKPSTEDPGVYAMWQEFGRAHATPT